MSRRYPLKRPLYVVGMSFGLALFLATAVGFHAAVIAAVLCALLFVLSLSLRTLRQYEGVTAALLAACAAFAMFAGWEYVAVQPLQQWDGRTASLTLWIEEEVGETDRSITYFARVREGDLPQNTRLLVRVTNGGDAPQLHDRVQARVPLESTDEWRSQNVFLSGWINDCTVTVSDERPWDYALAAWRQAVLGRLETRADGDVAALLRAICFGDKTQLSSNVKDGFAAAGLSHVTAVSGFHMSVVSMGLFAFLRFLGLRRRWAALLSLPFPFLFAALTGFSYSAMRAGVMTCLMLLGAVFRRAADGRNSLGGAVIVLLAFDMTAVYDLGLQLSVAATWGILTAQALQPKTVPNRLQSVARNLQLTVAAVVATLPLSALNFGETSALAPLTNLIAQPIAAVIVSAGCFGTLLLCVPFLSFLGAPLVLVAGVAARLLLWIGDLSLSLPISFLRLDEPYLVVWAVAVPFCLLLGWLLLKAHGARVMAMLLVIALCASALTFHVGMRGVTALRMTNVTDGAVILLSRDGHHAAVVTGDPSARQVQRVLRAAGVSELDAVVYAADEVAVQTAVKAEEYLPATDETRTAAAMTLTLWKDTALQWQDGWCRITLGERAVLIAPCDGTTDDLPAAFKTAEIAVFDRDPPTGSETLALGQVVLCCSEDALPDVTRELLWGVYPIEVTRDETVTIKLR